MSLATSDAGGLWVADVTYVSDDLTVYWPSHPLVRHSRALERNPFVAGSITLNTEPHQLDKGLQFSGVARRFRDDSTRVLPLYNKKRKNDEDVSLPQDFVWYCLQLTLIDLIYEPLFGKEKKSFEGICSALLVRNRFSQD